MNSRKAKSSEVTIDHTVTLNMGISEMLDAFNLGSAFDEVILKFTNAYDMQQGADAEKFIFSKLDELKDYVNTHKKDGTTAAELKTILVDWIEHQNDAIDKELNDAWIEMLESPD